MARRPLQDVPARGARDWFSLESLGVLVRRHRVDDTVTKAITRILRSDLVMVMVDDISHNFSRDLFGWDVVRAGRRVGLIVPDGYGRSAGVARGRAFHGRWGPRVGWRVSCCSGEGGPKSLPSFGYRGGPAPGGVDA